MTSETKPVERNSIAKSLKRIAIFLFVACILALILGYFVLLNIHLSPEQQIAAIRSRNPSFNMENTTPNVDAPVLEATQQALLNSYGWVDQNARIARIPIERAMQLLIQQESQPTATPRP